jgi:hypothetical protein
MVNAEIATLAPVEMVTEFRFRSAPDVPTDISRKRVVAFAATIAAQPAVPPAQVESDVIVLAVATLDDAAANALVEGNAKLATMVFPAVTALEVSAGCEPA